jgi:predicted metal-dependent HD superfamily phosphohydrolase
MPAEPDLQSRFEALWRGAVGTDSAARAWRALETGYGEPQRAYHNWSHIGAMLSGLDEASGEAEFDDMNFDEVELAIFFHDAIYDPRAKDNERKSAELFLDVCDEGASSQTNTRHIADMILATATHAGHADLATRLLLDLDLRVLGGAPEHYAAYAEAVRSEYSFVPDKAWRDGRSAVLKRFLDRDRLFQTAHFLRLCEEQARKNIAAELEALAET